VTHTDYKKFANIMGGMAMAFQKEVAKQTIEIYFRFLKDLPIEKIEKSVSELIYLKKISTLPTIGEIRGIIEGSAEDKALEAWHKAINNVDYYISVSFDDPIIHSVIEMEFGGWEKFCNLCVKDEIWDKRRFIQAYLLYAKRGEHPKYLPGFFERENKLHGYNYDEGIKQIGGSKKIKRLKE